MAIKVVLAGPPRSGKSCLREGLKQALRNIEGAPYGYVITACPDGEGSWYQATVERSPEDAAACKAAYKAKFTPGFVARIAESVRDCNLPLCLVDIGGVVSPENRAICAQATHIVILAGDPARMDEWRQFAADLGLKIVAEVCSNYNDVEDVVENNSDGILKGSVHHLERGEPVADRPMVRALAHLLSRLAA